MARQDDPAQEALRKLDAVVRLLALQMTDGLKTVEKIRLLSKAGLDRHLIAELAGTTPDAVSVRLSEFKRHGAKGVLSRTASVDLVAEREESPR